MGSSSSPDVVFMNQVTLLMPNLKALARSLCRNWADADDLVQNCLTRAWCARASFKPGSNLKAWLCVIMRNQFYSDCRTSTRQRKLVSDHFDGELVENGDLSAAFELDHVRRALDCLPDDQRQAVILVGAGGLSYEEAAELTDCPVGTMKSRVSRGRERLSAVVSDGRTPYDAVRPSQAASALIAEIGQRQVRPLALAA